MNETKQAGAANSPKLLRPSPCDLTKPCLLFFDLDGTLLRSGRLPEENRIALLRAKEKGHRLFINSGRSKAHTPREVFERIPWDGMVCGSGYVELGGKVLQNRSLSTAQLRAVIDFSLKEKLPLVMEGVKNDYAVGCDFGVRLDTPAERENFLRTENGDVTKITFLGLLPGTPSGASSPAVTFPGLHVITFPTYAEAILADCTKAKGMELICRTLGTDLRQAVAFGDSANDREMLEAAGLAVVMPECSGGIGPLSHLRLPDCTYGVAKAIELLFGV